MKIRDRNRGREKRWKELASDTPREEMVKVKPKGTRELSTYLAEVTVEVVYTCRYNVCGRRRWSRIGEEPSKMVGD